MVSITIITLGWWLSHRLKKILEDCTEQIDLYEILFKEAVSRDFFAFFFFSLIQPNWVPDKQSKMVSLKIRFREDIRKKRDYARCDTAQSRTLRSITLRRVGKLKCPKIQNRLTLRRVGLRAVCCRFLKTSISRTFRVYVMIFRKCFENISKIEKWLTLRRVYK